MTKYNLNGEKMKTLFVSDLDKTLLKDDQTLSPFTCDTLNMLIEKGMIFTYATARSANTAKKATEGLSGHSYAVVYNGVFIVENETGRTVTSMAFSKEESSCVIDTVLSYKVSPRVFSLVDGKERFTYTEKHLESLGAQEYFRTRNNDPRGRLGNEKDLYEGEVFTISCVAEKKKLEPVYERLKENFRCHFYLDSYSSDWYLEVLPNGASKADAILKLKKILGCEKVVSFGDGMNDFSMFTISEECYAVENAHPDLKAIATGIIGSNEDDGVAKFLLERFGAE